MGSSIVASEQAGQVRETPYRAFRFRLVAGASGSAGATSGGVFHNDALVPGVNQAVPIDVCVPGCPPRPEQFIYAILTLQRKIEAERGSFRRTVNWS